jgi:hypothetical protein
MRTEKMIYQNGNRVKVGDDSDHSTVRDLIRKGVVKNVDNFGPLLSKESGSVFISTQGLDKVTADGYELFIKPSTGIALSSDFSKTTELRGVQVYYQRIKA